MNPTYYTPGTERGGWSKGHFGYVHSIARTLIYLLFVNHRSLIRHCISRDAMVACYWRHPIGLGINHWISSESEIGWRPGMCFLGGYDVTIEDGEVKTSTDSKMIRILFSLGSTVVMYLFIQRSDDGDITNRWTNPERWWYRDIWVILYDTGLRSYIWIIEWFGMIPEIYLWHQRRNTLSGMLCNSFSKYTSCIFFQILGSTSACSGFT